MNNLGRAISFGGGLLLVSGSLLALACSTSTGVDPGSGTSPTTPQDAAPDRPDAPAVPPGMPAVDAGGGDSGDPNCHPPKLHPTKAGDGVYCPYSKVDGGKNLTCTQAQQCCETPNDDAGASTCNVMGSACPVADSTIWQCEDSTNCGAGKVCCSSVKLEPDSVCGYLRGGPGFTGTTCKTACAAGEMTICQQQSSCTSGTCTPFLAVGNEVGACK